MGQPFHQQIANIQQSQQAPQTGANPNPPAATVTPQPAGKGGAVAPQPVQAAPAPQAAGKGGSSVTYPSQSGQPQMGVPNQYTNTIQTGDNTAMQSSPQLSQGKGGSTMGTNQARGKGQ